MKSLCVLLAAAIIQGSVGQEDIFSVEPRAENIVSEGDNVTLECITREPETCGWRLNLEGKEHSFLSMHGVPEGLGIRVRDPATGSTDCSLIIDSVEMKHSGTYTCAPFTSSSGQVEATPAVITVAVKPAAVEFTGAQAGATELQASSNQELSVACEARDARPAAELRWFLGERELSEGAVSEETTDEATRLITTASTLTHRFEPRDEGATLRCEATHLAYEGAERGEAALTVVVKFAPTRAEGTDLGTLYGFTEGEAKDITVNFTANPAPNNVMWTVGPDARPLIAPDQEGHITAGAVEEVDPAAHKYSVKLTLDPVKPEDLNATFALRLENEVGSTDFSLRLGSDAPPPSATVPPPQAAEGGITGGAIGGIIVAVIVLLAVIALLAFARSRGKWCFAAEDGGEARKEWRAHMDPEAAEREGHDNPGHEQKQEADAAEPHHNGTNGTNGTNGNTKLPTDTPV